MTSIAIFATLLLASLCGGAKEPNVYDLQKEIKQLQRHLEVRKESVDDLEMRLQSCKEDLSDYTEEETKYETEMQKTLDDLQTMHLYNQKLKAQLGEKKERLVTLEAIITKAGLKLPTEKSSAAGEEIKTTSCPDDLIAKERKLMDLQTQFLGLQETHVKSLNDYKSCNDTVKERDGVIAGTYKTIADLKKELKEGGSGSAKCSSDLTSQLEEQLQKSKDSNEQCTIRHQNVESELEATQKKLGDCSEARAAGEKELQAAQEGKDVCQEEKSHAEAVFEATNEKYNKCKEQYSILEKQLQKSEDSKNVCIEEYKNVQAQMEKTREKYEKCMEEKTKINKECDDCRGAVDTLGREVQDAKDSTGLCASELRNAQTKLTDCEKTRSNLQKEFAERDQECVALSEYKNNINQVLAQCQNLAKEKDEVLAKKEDEIRSLKKSDSEKDEKQEGQPAPVAETGKCLEERVSNKEFKKTKKELETTVNNLDFCKEGLTNCTMKLEELDFHNSALRQIVDNQDGSTEQEKAKVNTLEKRVRRFAKAERKYRMWFAYAAGICMLFSAYHLYGYIARKYREHCEREKLLKAEAAYKKKMEKNKKRK